MGLGDADLLDDGDVAGGGGGGKAVSSISCSICLEDVTDYGDRAWAKLQCGHQFHLDCIGSAFNVKGVMQCPNCRKVEKGQWLYADGCLPYPELNIDDLVNDDLYDLSYSESSMWCPFGGFTRLATAFEEGDFPPTAYHDLVGQHARVSSATHLCPYIAYVQPLQSDGPSYNSQWNGQSEMRTMDFHYHALFQTSSSRIDHPSMPPRTNADMPTSGSYVHPFLFAQSGGSRGPSSIGLPMIHPYPGSAARARERFQALEAYFQQPSSVAAIRTPIPPASRGPNGQVGSSGVYYLPRSIPEMLNHTLERDFFHQASFRQRHGSPSQNQYR